MLLGYKRRGESANCSGSTENCLQTIKEYFLQLWLGNFGKNHKNHIATANSAIPGNLQEIIICSATVTAATMTQASVLTCMIITMTMMYSATVSGAPLTNNGVEYGGAYKFRYWRMVYSKKTSKCLKSSFANTTILVVYRN